MFCAINRADYHTCKREQIIFSLCCNFTNSVPSCYRRYWLSSFCFAHRSVVIYVTNTLCVITYGKYTGKWMTWCNVIMSTPIHFKLTYRFGHFKILPHNFQYYFFSQVWYFMEINLDFYQCLLLVNSYVKVVSIFFHKILFISSFWTFWVFLCFLVFYLWRF